MSTTDYTPVTFQNSQGETISNDPIYLAQQTLAAAGISEGSSEEALTDRYDDMKQKELKDEAAERGVDPKAQGIKTVAQLRDALRALDEAEEKAANGEGSQD